MVNTNNTRLKEKTQKIFKKRMTWRIPDLDLQNIT